MRQNINDFSITQHIKIYNCDSKIVKCFEESLKDYVIYLSYQQLSGEGKDEMGRIKEAPAMQQ